MGIILTIIILYFISSHYESKNEEEFRWCCNYRYNNIKHPKLTNKIMKKHDMFVGRSEQLKCQCKNAKFTRTVDADFNPLCGRCGKAL